MGLFAGIIGAILIAILLTAIFYYAFKSHGPWGSIWTFFLVLLLSVWAASLWVQPVGPVFWGIAWVPLFFVGLIIAMLLAAIPDYDSRNKNARMEEAVEPEEIEQRNSVNRTAAAVSGTFWIFMSVLLLAILIGYAI